MKLDGYRRAFFNDGVDELETSLKRVSRPNGRYPPPPQLNLSNGSLWRVIHAKKKSTTHVHFVETILINNFDEMLKLMVNFIEIYSEQI